MKYALVWYNHRDYTTEIETFDSEGELTLYLVRESVKKQNIVLIFRGEDVTEAFDTSKTR